MLSAVPVITSAPAEDVTVGSNFSFTITTTGSPVPKITRSGALPPGLKFIDNGNGTATIDGTADTTSTKVFPLKLDAVNADGTGTQTLMLDITQNAMFTSPEHATFVVGTFVKFKVKSFDGFTDGAQTPLTLTGSIPGMTFTDNGDGTATLSGTPTTQTLTTPVVLTFKSGSVTHDVSVTVEGKAEFGGATSSGTWMVGESNTVMSTLSVAGTPVAAIGISGGSLPRGLTFKDLKDGTFEITGTPKTHAGGIYVLKLDANDAAGAATDEPFTFTITVDQTTVFTTPAAATFTAGKLGTFDIRATGTPEPDFSQGGNIIMDSSLPSGPMNGTLPDGLTFTGTAKGTAKISGTPAAGSGGIYHFDITDANGDTQEFTLTVDEAPTFASRTSAATVDEGSPITPITIATTAGFPTPKLTEAGLTAGLTFTDNGDGTATISGTPATGTIGTHNVSIEAKNSFGTGLQALALKIVVT